MERSNRLEWTVWGVCALTLAATLALLPVLPERIPMHWNVDGQIDGWVPRFGAFYIPLSQLGLCALMKLLPVLDPKRANYKRFGGAYGAFRLALALFLCVMQGLVLCAAFDPQRVEAARAIPACLGVLLCVAGNYMPKFRHNYFCGIRTPWTLADASCWRRTHRMAGPLWFWGGLALAAASFLLPPRPLAAVVAVLGVAICLFPTAASYFFYRDEAKRGE